jgi:hypothetical protein
MRVKFAARIRGVVLVSTPVQTGTADVTHVFAQPLVTLHTRPSHSCTMCSAAFGAPGVRRIAAAIVTVHDMIALTAFNTLVCARFPFSLPLLQCNLSFLLIFACFLLGRSLVVPRLQIFLEHVEIGILLPRPDVAAALRLWAIRHVPTTWLLAATRHDCERRGSRLCCNTQRSQRPSVNR